MPSLYLPSMQRHLALTPPECIYYPLNAANLPPIQDGYYYDIGGQGLPNDIFDASTMRKITKPNNVPVRKDSLYNHPAQVPHTNYYAPPARRENPFGPIGPPMLPPLRIPDNMDRNRPVQIAGAPRMQHQQPPREEKASGGVAVHLDYNMDHMVDFVAEMSCGMYDLFGRLNLADVDLSQTVQPGIGVSTSFRSFVSQILCATRLPSTSILCALNYLAERMSMLSEHGYRASSRSQIYRMLTVAMMIASKFLDDNTFQNRSWSDVSDISVTELNKHEMEWLMGMSWDLHVDTRELTGLSSWIRKWDAFKAMKQDELSLERLRLNNPENSRVGPHAVAHMYSPPTPVFTPSTDSTYTMSARDTPIWQPWGQSRDLSPPSARQSGPATPEWYGRNGYPAASNGWPAQPGLLPPLSSIRSAVASPYWSPYGEQCSITSWGHGAGCGCGYCALQHDRYGMGHSYGIQPVMG